jgi:hypothetical protein
VLVDTSLSMARVDAEVVSGAPASPRRIEQVTNALRDTALLDALRQNHDVTVVKFDAGMQRVASLPKLPESGATNSDKANASENDATEQPTAVDWRTVLEPHGGETRVGQAVRDLLNDERGSPISAVVVFTDGAQNAGVEIAAAIKAAQEAKVPVHAIGIGSPDRPASVRIADLIAPARAYPGDGFHLTGYLQSRGLAGRQVTVELHLLDPTNAKGEQGGEVVLDRTERVTLGGDSEVVPVRIEIPGLESAGRRIARLRIKPMPEDKDQSDNQQEVDIDVVDRKSRVLLFAGGPTRDYQFLRNMLRRSELSKKGDMIVDVLLQTAQEGVSQDANQILDDFPRTMQELAEYDTIVAFDPDWRELDPAQIELIDKWVGEQSGGLIATAGPVYTDAWVQDTSMGTLRSLYPVEFNRRLALLEDARYGSEQAWPLEFTREGLEAEFLWLDDDAAASQEVWESFAGVYGYYRARGAKPGATAYAFFSDPEATIGDRKPIYFAGHFYGSGRVFFMGSGEIWRLRELDDRYFDTFYTKLIRHVSQGRLLRGSKLGSLLVERDRYIVGNTVVVKAQLNSPQQQPLEVSSVKLQVTQRDGVPLAVDLAADPARKGMYGGQFTVTQEGECRLALIHPDAPDEPLTKRLQVFVPKLEQENPERNDKLLKELTDGTGGLLYLGVPSAIGAQSVKPLVAQLQDRTQETFVAGRKDRDWEETWMHMLLAIIAGCLCVEWIVRRLCRLA